jgi:hypothetical protein
VRILAEPRALAELTEIDPEVPEGAEDRFRGYGVMGLPFASGHVLALRRFPASSLGYGYSSVWHRDPGGRWTFWSDVSPQTSCARFFGEAIDEAVRAPIAVRWTDSRVLRVTVGDGVLDWQVSLRSTPVTVVMNAAAGLLTDGMWRSPRVLYWLGVAARQLLGVGRVAFTGKVPNGQRFAVNPQRVWLVGESAASLRGRDLGVPGPLLSQARLADFAIPQRGMFALGRSFLEPFDPRRHSDAVVRGGMKRDEAG